MRALTFNPWIGQDATDDPRDPHDLRDHLRNLVRVTEEPPVVALQEVWDWTEALPGYRRIQAPRSRFPGRKARSTILLVRRDLEVVGRGARQAEGGGWTGPKHGLPHDPHVYPRVSFRDPREPDLVWDVIGVHRTRPGWSPQGRAYRGEHRVLVDWTRDRRPGPVVLLGDHNGPMDDLARDIRGEAHLLGVDGVVARGCVVVGQHRVAGHFGGDGHRPVLTRLVARPHA